MTLLVVVVATAEEATAAVDGGADRLLVDRSGRDGPPALDALARAVAGRRPVSLASPGDDVGSVLAAVRAIAADELVVPAAVVPRWAALAAHLRRIAVLPVGAGSQPAEAPAGCHGVLLGDRAQPERLLASFTVAELTRHLRAARADKRAIGFGGTLELPDVPRLAALEPDFIVLDGVVRADGRMSAPVDPTRLGLVRDLVRDTRIGGPVMPVAVGHDRIFVRDWTVAVRLGAYAHEREAQQVRFTVEAEVVRSPVRRGDLRDVVTYDLIVDAIGRATATHVDLVETIAEDVAATVLAHPRIASVAVTVDKLDRGPGALGCRILRRRDDGV